jgi:Fe-S cluster assembly protein SufD
MTTLTQHGYSISELNADRLPQTGPQWLRDLRQRASEHFTKLGLPTARHEEWRFTNLRPLQSLSFTEPTTTALPAEAVDGFNIPGLSCPRLVFVNGSYDEAASQLGATPAGVEVMTLSQALSQREELLREHLGKLATSEEDAFTALNTALMDEATVIYVPADQQIETPLHVLHVSTSDTPIATHPRTIIIVEAGSEFSVIEDHVSPDESVYLTNAVTEIFVGDDANVHHYFLERESPQAYNVSTLKVHQGRESHFESHSALFGGVLVRNNVNPILAGENCHSLLNGLYVGRNKQHHDNHMRVNHDEPNCDSRQYYRGILGDESRGVFSGRIVVAQKAQKTDAVQSNQNLLLSDNAQANTKPQLEIYADDVKCTHGATIGELDEEAIFYLRSRGMSADAARGMLIYSFAKESLDRVDLEPLRDLLTDMLVERVPQTRLLHGLL